MYFDFSYLNYELKVSEYKFGLGTLRRTRKVYKKKKGISMLITEGNLIHLPEKKTKRSIFWTSNPTFS